MNKSTRTAAAIFEAALQLPLDRRAAYIEEACGGDAPLRRRVEDLFGALAAAGSFMEEPVAAPRPAAGATSLSAEPESSCTVFDSNAPGSLPAQEAVGQTIGRYKLLEKLGEGGCGVVYVAEQTEPVRRRVALKVIKLGMDTHQVIVRFEAERQALAMMDHPHIARVLDGGATETGRPYFAMELVRGVPITHYCDQAHLTTHQRLDLFIQVCQAIQHAHQKGIIHRDIKPSNILVTLHDGVPVPKVIDFGIAKAIEGRLTDGTLYTQLHQFIGTPAYMSPEQAEMTGLDIDTRSDIYSLGVLLYELLAGSTPFNANELMAAGIDAMRQIIREQEPVRPSTRFGTLLAEDSTTTAQRRSTDTVRLAHQLRGDLDWIVMKCLEKDRTRRYETANGLAADLKRHLDNEPVIARPPSTAYRLQKAISRNKLAFAAAAAVFAVLTLGVMISAWQAMRANREAGRAVAAEGIAQQRLGESEAISKFMTEVFQSPDPTRDGREIKVMELLDKAANKLETDLASQPDQRAQLQGVLAGTYFCLGLYRQAIPLQEKVRDYLLKTSGLEHARTLLAMDRLASFYSEARRIDEALKLREEVLPLMRKVNGPEHPDTLRSMGNLALNYDAANRKDEAIKLQEEVLRLMRKVNGPEHPETLWAMDGVAFCYMRAGRRDEGIKLQEEALRLMRKVNGLEHPRTIGAMHALAGYYNSGAGRQGEAIKLQEEALRLMRKVNGPEHPRTLGAMHSLANYYGDTGRNEEALGMREELLRLRRKLPGREEPDIPNVMNRLADSYHAVGRPAEAIKMHEEVLRLRREVQGPEHPDTLWAMGRLADAYRDVGRKDEALKLHDEAIKLQEDALRLMRKVNGPEHSGTLDAMHRLATDYNNEAGRKAEAIKLLEEALPLTRKVHGPEHINTIHRTYDLANYYGDTGRKEEALGMREELLRLRRKLRGPEHPDIPNVMNRLADSYHAVGRPAEAIKMHEEVLRLRREVQGPEHPDTLWAMGRLAGAYRDAGRKDEALKLQEEELPLMRKVHGPVDHRMLDSMNQLANSYSDAGRQMEAMQLRDEHFAISLREAPNSTNPSQTYASIGFALDAAGRGEKAILAWKEAVRMDPTGTPMVHYRLGKALVDRQRHAEALPILHATLKFFPDGEEGRETVVRIALAEADLKPRATEANVSNRLPLNAAMEKWLTVLRQAAAARPPDTDKARHIATVHYWLGETNEHQTLCGKLLEAASNSQDPTAHDRAAKAYLIQTRPDSETLKLAVMSGHQALKLAANDADRAWFLITLAMAEIREQRPAEAEILLNESLAMADDTRERRVLGLAYRTLARARLNRMSEARADLSVVETFLPSAPVPPTASAIFFNADLMAAFLACEEARAVLNPPPTPTP